MDNDAIVNGNMDLNTVNVNNFVGGTIITTDPYVPASSNTQDLEFTGNFITTTTQMQI